MSYSYLTLIEATKVQRGQFILFSVIGKGSAFKLRPLWFNTQNGTRLGSGARLFQVSNAHASGLCVWVLAGVRCREGPQMLLRIHRRWCQMLPFVSVFWGGGKGKPLRLLKKGSAEKAACFRRIHPGPLGRLSSGKVWTWVGMGGMRHESSGLACCASGRS